MDKQFSRIVVVAGVVNICLAVSLIPVAGAQGAAAAVLVSEFFVTSAMALVLQRKGIVIFPKVWVRGDN
jgi:O-antigen/teichoic acid export membrane protein